MPDSLHNLTRQLEKFAAARDWQQFHTPKNLASALIVEAAELLEHFQWLTPLESQQLDETQRSEVAAEMADVLLYLLRLSSTVGVDLIAAAESKLRVNEQRYPVDLARGSKRKYHQLQQEAGLGGDDL